MNRGKAVYATLGIRKGTIVVDDRFLHKFPDAMTTLPKLEIAF